MNGAGRLWSQMRRLAIMAYQVSLFSFLGKRDQLSKWTNRRPQLNMINKTEGGLHGLILTREFFPLTDCASESSTVESVDDCRKIEFQRMPALSSSEVGDSEIKCGLEAIGCLDEGLFACWLSDSMFPLTLYSVHSW